MNILLQHCNKSIYSILIAQHILWEWWKAADIGQREPLIPVPRSHRLFIAREKKFPWISLSCFQMGKKCVMLPSIWSALKGPLHQINSLASKHPVKDVSVEADQSAVNTKDCCHVWGHSCEICRLYPVTVLGDRRSPPSHKLTLRHRLFSCDTIWVIPLKCVLFGLRAEVIAIAERISWSHEYDVTNRCLHDGSCFAA